MCIDIVEIQVGIAIYFTLLFTYFNFNLLIVLIALTCGSQKNKKKLDRAVDGIPSEIPTLLTEIALVPHSIVLSNQAKFYLYVILLIIPFNLICHMTML